MAVDDRYTIPGSGGALKNKLGLTTVEAVDHAMNEAATRRWALIAREPIPDQLDLAYLCSIHRRLLSPVLDWAGELRQAGDEVAAGGTGITYALSAFFRNGLDDVFGQLAAEDYLRGLPREVFADRLADRWGYLTATHPFRDGNTRTQSAYVDRLANRAGHPIMWENINVDALREARLHAVSRSHKPLATLLLANLASDQHAPSEGPLRQVRKIARTFSTRALSDSPSHEPRTQAFRQSQAQKRPPTL